MFQSRVKLRLCDWKGKGSGQMVGVLSFYSDDPLYNTTEAYLQFNSVKLCEKYENKRKRARERPIFEELFHCRYQQQK